MTARNVVLKKRDKKSAPVNQASFVKAQKHMENMRLLRAKIEADVSKQPGFQGFVLGKRIIILVDCEAAKENVIQVIPQTMSKHIIFQVMIQRKYLQHGGFKADPNFQEVSK